MVEWEKEFKKYIANKFREKLGFNIDPHDIKKLEVNTNIDLTQLLVDELAMVYAFAIMREDFEQAKVIADELETRNCEVKIDVDDANKSGAINIYLKPEVSIPYLDIKMKILPDGMIIDFEKQQF